MTKAQGPSEVFFGHPHRDTLADSDSEIVDGDFRAQGFYEVHRDTLPQEVVLTQGFSDEV
jgi:hypothetical protein